MSKKKKNSEGGIVYSTDANYAFEDLGSIWGDQNLPKEKQDLRVGRTSKGRGGKTVTVISNFKGKAEDLEALAKVVKTKVGTGGAVKDGEIVMQGDIVQRVMDVLVAEGYKVKRTGG